MGKGTVTKARKKLKAAAFRELLHKAVGFVYSHSPDLNRPAGMRIIGIDGSRLTLPETPALRSYFGPKRTGAGTEGPPQARVSLCLDVLNGIVVDALIRPLSWGERRMAEKHLRFLGENDLVLLDRGYAGVAFFRKILRTGADICARVKVGHSREVAAFVASGRSSAPIRLTDEDGFISLRAIRIELSSGITEVLLTSLTDWQVEPDFFGRIYQLRWGIESEYHFLKAALELENFSGKTVLAVQQDFYAHVFSSSLTAMLSLPVHEQIERLTARCKHTYQLSWTETFALVRPRFGRLLLKAVESSLDCLADILNKLLTAPYRFASRPGRSFPRRERFKPVRFPMNQKSV